MKKKKKKKKKSVHIHPSLIISNERDMREKVVMVIYKIPTLRLRYTVVSLKVCVAREKKKKNKRKMRTFSSLRRCVSKV